MNNAKDEYPTAEDILRGRSLGSMTWQECASSQKYLKVPVVFCFILSHGLGFLTETIPIFNSFFIFLFKF